MRYTILADWGSMVLVGTGQGNVGVVSRVLLDELGGEPDPRMKVRTIPPGHRDMYYQIMHFINYPTWLPEQPHRVVETQPEMVELKTFAVASEAHRWRFGYSALADEWFVQDQGRI